MSLRLGDRVRARLLDTGDHHRLPRYVQGRIGTVVAYRGEFPLPDVVVHGDAHVRRGLYCVHFAASDLWTCDSAASSGHGTASGHGVHLDLFECYLRHEGCWDDKGGEMSS